jgi:hypothetical protein
VAGQNVILQVNQRSADHYFNTAAFSDPQPYKIGESKHLELRAESFNLLNHPNIGVPGPYPVFGPYFGKNFSTGQPRRYQVALRFGF